VKNAYTFYDSFNLSCRAEEQDGVVRRTYSTGSLTITPGQDAVIPRRYQFLSANWETGGKLQCIKMQYDGCDQVKESYDKAVELSDKIQNSYGETVFLSKCDGGDVLPGTSTLPSAITAMEVYLGDSANLKKNVR
jgi:hypothetical protein